MKNPPFFKLFRFDPEASLEVFSSNKFVTVDGFQVGYYVDKGNVHWYVRLEKNGSDATLFMDRYETIETAFSEAKNKIDSLKSK